MNLGAFPMVSDGNYRAGRSYQALWRRWRSGDVRPLHISGTVLHSMVGGVDGAIHFDGVLSSALFNSRMVGRMVNDLESFVLPLPLALQWVDGDGRPLWLATDFRAIAPQQGATYIHSRYPTHRAERADRQAVLTSAGRYKDSRIPLRVTASHGIEAWCIGIADDIRTLLEEVTHVGKKPALGYGRVASWTVQPAPGIDANWILERKSVPVAALGGASIAADRIAPHGAWTPPYWDQRLHTICRRPAWTS